MSHLYNTFKSVCLSINSGYMYYTVQLLSRILFIRWIYFGSNHKNIPTNGPLLLVANHVSKLDPWIISIQLSIYPHPYWVAKKELWSFEDTYVDLKKYLPSFFAWFLSRISVFVIKHSYTIPLDRNNTISSYNRASYAKISEILKNNGIVGIFPEGGTNRKGVLTTGFIKFSEKYNVAILPIFIDKKTKKVLFHDVITKQDLDKFIDDNEKAQYVMNIIYHNII